jgi:putative oxidoreductase
MAVMTHEAPAAPPRAALPLPARTPALDDIGKLLLRVTLGVLVLMHGIAKVQNGVGPIMDALSAAGWPVLLAYGVYVGEVVAPLFLIVGVWARAAALVVAFNMAVAIGLMHGADLDKLSPSGGWAIELQAWYLAAAFAVALLGAGRMAPDGGGRWRRGRAGG